MQEQIPDAVRNKLAQFQTLQQQLQMVSVQKQQLVVEKSELDAASSELEKAKSDTYKSVGPLLIKATKADIKKEVDDVLVSVSNRITLLEKQEQKLATKAQEIQKDLTASMSANAGKATAD